MGGIIAKKALLGSDDSNVGSSALSAKNTRGILFMGMPHQGSKAAEATSTLTRIIHIVHQLNDSVVNELRNRNTQLQQLHHRFHQLLTKREQKKRIIEVRCFCETKLVIGSGLVAQPHAAAPPMYESIPVDADHVETTKFSSREDKTYKNVLAELRRMINLAKERRENERHPSMQRGGMTHTSNNDQGAYANYGSRTIGMDKGGSIHYGNKNNSRVRTQVVWRLLAWWMSSRSIVPSALVYCIMKVYSSFYGCLR